MEKRIVLLGSTGSIGTQALEVVRENAALLAEGVPGLPVLKVAGLAADKNVDRMERQAREFLPEACCMYDPLAAKELQVRLGDLPIRVYGGMEGLLELASMEKADLVLTALVGMIGIRPTVAAIRAGKDIALANKETLVAAGEIIMPLVREYGVKLLPVDSEHSAIFQCLNGEAHGDIEEIELTASGGPFCGKTEAELLHVTKADALKHPSWSMGEKITVDSATMVNKGLELMEAMHLFQVKPEQIRIVVQPGSILHSAVLFRDGAMMAQLSHPDMKLPIRYAFYFPLRVPVQGARLSLSALARLSFEEPDLETFRGLKTAIKAARTGGTLPAVFNAANEAAVSLFLREKLRFLEIYDRIEEACARHRVISRPSLEDIFAAEAEAKEAVLYGCGG